MGESTLGIVLGIGLLWAATSSGVAIGQGDAANSANAPVKVVDADNSVTLENGLITLKINKANANVLSLQYQGMDLVDGSGYWNVLRVDGPYAICRVGVRQAWTYSRYQCRQRLRRRRSMDHSRTRNAATGGKRAAGRGRAQIFRTPAAAANPTLLLQGCGSPCLSLLEPLLDRQQCFVIRSTGKRTVIGKWHLERRVAEFAAKCRLRHRARVVKIDDEREKTCDLRFGVEQIRLPGRSELLDLVIVAGFGKEPMMLLTNALNGARDSESLW